MAATYHSSPMNPISARLLAQQLISPLFRTPHDVVSWFGAMQAQDYRAMRWAVAMRTSRPSLSAFRSDFDGGRIIRTHLLRTTWQLVSGEDYRWILSLCREKALGGLRGWMRSNGIEITDSEKYRMQELLCDIMSGGGSFLKEDIALALSGRGIPMDGHRLSYHLRLAELDGIVCSGDLHPTQRTLALASRKVGTYPVPQRDEALALLAGKYFRSHGPATLEDFVWWSGLGVGECKRAVSIIGDGIRSETIGGRRYYISSDARTRGFRTGNVLLIPAFDEYLIGYKSRHVVLSPEHAPYAHNNSGIFHSVVTLDGEIVGNWRPGDRDLGVSVFKDGVSIPHDAICRERERYESALRI